MPLSLTECDSEPPHGWQNGCMCPETPCLPACLQCHPWLQGTPTPPSSGDPLGLRSQLHLTPLSDVRESVEPPSTSVSHVRKIDIQTASTSACCWGQPVGVRRGSVHGSCRDPRCRGCFPVQCHSVPESYQSRNPETREGSASPHQGHRLLQSRPLPRAPPNPVLRGQTVSHRQR